MNSEAVLPKSCPRCGKLLALVTEDIVQRIVTYEQTLEGWKIKEAKNVELQKEERDWWCVACGHLLNCTEEEGVFPEEFPEP